MKKVSGLLRQIMKRLSLLFCVSLGFDGRGPLEFVYRWDGGIGMMKSTSSPCAVWAVLASLSIAEYGVNMSFGKQEYFNKRMNFTAGWKKVQLTLLQAGKNLHTSLPLMAGGAGLTGAITGATIAGGTVTKGLGRTVWTYGHIRRVQVPSNLQGGWINKQPSPNEQFGNVLKQKRNKLKYLFLFLVNIQKITCKAFSDGENYNGHLDGNWARTCNVLRAAARFPFLILWFKIYAYLVLFVLRE